MDAPTSPPPDAPYRVPRRATTIDAQGQPQTRFLADWRGLDAYVLLGDPGAGKSESFESEKQACQGKLVPPRDIVDRVAAIDVGAQTVFIDGLDEVRAGTADGQVPFGAIREWLNLAGRPRFRLSCREADWLGQSDAQALARVAPGGQVTVLHLDALTREEQLQVLGSRVAEVSDPQAFMSNAERMGIAAMLGNPLLLDLTIKAMVAIGGDEPKTRKDVYDAACQQLATEFNTEHQVRRPPGFGAIDRLLDDAGLLCAVLLLSQKQAVSAVHSSAPDTLQLSDLPPTLRPVDAAAALATKVFTTVAGRSTPRHRSIAEFLAAKALAKRLAEGLPLGRLMALIQGFDGRPVEPLRGLFGWLLTLRIPDRERLMQLDPLGVVLNGDVTAWTCAERAQLLDALKSALEHNPYLLHGVWVNHPFGALATADMADTFEALLRAPQRDRAHLALLGVAFKALSHGQAMPTLTDALQAWVQDPAALPDAGVSAYLAWKHNAGFDPAKALAWLEQRHRAQVADANDRLASTLLRDLYPVHLGPDQVLRFMRPHRHNNAGPSYSWFWRSVLMDQSAAPDFALLADAWPVFRPTTAGSGQDFQARSLAAELLAKALQHSGDRASNDRLFAWLGLCLDEHGFSTLKGEARNKVSEWLQARPARLKAVAALAYAVIAESRQPHFWEAEQRLHGVELPSDWPAWLLDQAAATAHQDLAKYCFQQAATVPINDYPRYLAPNPEDIVAWTNLNAHKWPAAAHWLEEVWVCEVDHSMAEHHRRQRKYQAERELLRNDRQRQIQPYWSALADGTAPMRAVHNLALAHQDMFSDIHGATPLARVQDYLVCDPTTAQAAIDGLAYVLSRDDLPSVAEIFKTDTKSKYHLLRPAALLAAEHQFAESAEIPLRWSAELAEKLVAFYLTNVTGNIPGWYRSLVRHRTDLVAELLLRYALPKLRRSEISSITSLWALGQDADFLGLAQRTLPTLLERFPLRATEAARGAFNRSLLSALPLLDDALAAPLVARKLARRGLDAGQRTVWLVAQLRYTADAAETLAAWVGQNERRAVALGVALEEQGSLGRSAHRLSPTALRRLIEVLAPITPSSPHSASGLVGARDERWATVRGLFNRLATDPSPIARDALRMLAASDQIGGWHDAAVYSAIAQQSAAREANFQVTSPAQVVDVIGNAAPANQADLLAMVMQQLGEIEAQLHHDPSFLVRQYWQGDGPDRVPHDENYCRDLLLAGLKDRLSPHNIDLGREASKANDKRVDMSASFMRSGKRISLPIEVKKENHRDLWTAWRDQLQRLYMTEPSAGQHGLYLALWFNHEPRKYEGVRPASARDLCQMLGRLIPERDRHQLRVQVLDLSLPPKPVTKPAQK